MKEKCEIIEDLLPLYQDKVCSDASTQLVEKHLKECSKCAKLAKDMEIEFEIPERKSVKDINKTIKHIISKYKKRIIFTIAAILVSIPILTVLIKLGINEYNKSGYCFSNLDDIKTAMKFAKNLKSKNFDAVVDKLDFSPDYYSIINYDKEPDFTNFEAIEINGECWYINTSSDIYDEYLEHSDNFFEYAVTSCLPGVFIPEYIFGETVKNSDDDSLPYNFYKVKAGDDYYYISSGWFMIENVCISPDNYIEDDNYELETYEPAVLSVVFPEKSYLAYVEQAMEEYEQTKEYILENYSNVLKMSPEEYNEYRRAESKKALEAFIANGFKITSVKYSDAYYNYESDKWNIDVSLLFDKAGKTVRAGMSVRVNNKNSISIDSFYSDGYESLLYEFFEALY